jgi:hypothetical protein
LDGIRRSLGGREEAPSNSGQRAEKREVKAELLDSLARYESCAELLVRAVWGDLKEAGKEFAKALEERSARATH